MYTIRYDLCEPSRHPPPLRPLPPLPPQAYLTSPKPFLHGSLLFHPVPSPSLRFSMADLYNGSLSCDSSAQQSFIASSNSSRNSTSSLIEFTESLLPPPPHSSRPFTPTNQVECRLQESLRKVAGPQSVSPVSKRSATPDQLSLLCSEFECLQTKRRDSAMFDVTQAARSTTRRGRTELDMQNNSSAMPALTHASRMAELVDNAEAFLGQQNAVALYSEPTPRYGESSFMDWDEDVPRLAKVKKSIADLKAVARSRAHSAPIAPAKSEASLETACSMSLTEPDTATSNKIDASLPRPRTQKDPFAQPSTPTGIGGRKSSHRRKTVFMMGSTRRFSQVDNQKSCLSTSKQSSLVGKRKRVSFASSNRSSNHHRGLSRLTHWMKKVVRCS